MTMVPSKNRKQNKTSTDYIFYNNNTTSDLMNQVVEETLYNNNNNYLGSEFMLRHMAEEEDNSSTQHHQHQPEPEPEPEAVSSSKEDQELLASNNNSNNNNNWLQLSIGFQQSETTTTTYTKHDHHHHHVPRSGLELELLTSNNWASSRPNMERGCLNNFPFEQTTSSSTSNISSLSMSMPSSGPSSTNFGQQQQIVPSSNSLHQWAFGPLLPHSMSSSSSTSSLRPSLGLGIGPYYSPFPLSHSPFHFPSSSSSSGFDPFRVVDPPRRPHSGIWFMLQASPNQGKEPFLPQIPKNYLRIKDGRMTVRLLLKYLVSKLKLHNESEIEIRCRGQQLLPLLTLQHVRDNIWTPRDTTSRAALLSDSSTTTDHVMVLHYGRTTV